MLAIAPVVLPNVAEAQLVNQFINNCPADTGVRCSEGSIASIFRLIINWALAIAFIAAVIILIYGGFLYITSAGNTDQAGKGKTAIQNALIGIVIIVLSYIIVQIVFRFVSGSGSGGIMGP
jgi:heme/copper-type cytochrome/quinol oxidase subunit 2